LKFSKSLLKSNSNQIADYNINWVIAYYNNILL